MGEGVDCRIPADIKWWDRNRFVLSVDEDLYRDDSSESDTEDDEQTENVNEFALQTALERIPFGKLYTYIQVSHWTLIAS